MSGARWDEAQGWRQRAEAWRKEIESPAAASAAGKKAPLRLALPKLKITGEEPAPGFLASLPWLKIGIGAVALAVAWPLLAGARRGASFLGSRLAPVRANRRRR
jgi:hypothetical protein